MKPVARTAAASELPPTMANIFPEARAAIGDPETFPWHRHLGRIQAFKAHSSQALAIDVFGAIRTSPARDRVLGAIAAHCALPPDGPWTLELEWADENRLLRETTSTQVDAIAIGRNAIIVIECKFREGGGSCSQTRRLQSGPATGKSQCNGRYEPQVNPGNGREGRCALSTKGIRYWEIIPEVFELDSAATYTPCPFKDDSFQWMRNLVLAYELGRRDRKAAAVMVVYAAGGEFLTERKVRSSDWLPGLRAAAPRLISTSYQRIVEIAAASDGDGRWQRLAAWVDAKVRDARQAPAP